MDYHDYKKAYRTWLIGLIIFTIAGIWFVYNIIVERTLNSVIFLIVFILILIFNYSRIRMMRNKVKEEFRKYKEEILKKLE